MELLSWPLFSSCNFHRFDFKDWLLDVIFLTFIKIEKIVVKHCPDDNCNRPVLIGPVGQIISYGLVTFRKKDTMRICNQVNINVYRSISSILVVQISREAQCWIK